MVALGDPDWTTGADSKFGRDTESITSLTAAPCQDGRIDEIRIATTLAGVITPASDTAPPLIVSPTSPADDASGVLVTTFLSATFDESIALVDGGTITIDDLGAGPDTLITLPDARVSVSDQTLTITPDAPLATSTNYAIQISNDADPRAGGVPAGKSRRSASKPMKRGLVCSLMLAVAFGWPAHLL